ncbi:probable dolichyl pyrophosphate Glc1Man9GlcNAc2 alpha-1,3-glucosyltransferase [Phymastichus coffea]|uniref:probable dolichyl pyrophosphate Glc1Man9GlcNAc2 alpha-1,3-glucosyltransferase n=1 Tax=Phymastichus coffea TaxID=108790 RepID=UPI00273C13AD|nr:probable dolichyl pyrophosphate Glc1Man9GlcNAc2 alpha-1,3-glucosyltransferase [Phymastichus coffea]
MFKMPNLLKKCDIHKTTPVGIDKIYCDKVLIMIFILITCIKALLIPTYHSTDFEVHRNWLAITHSLAVTEWYTNNKSQWTLDYPPFFAWFEYALSTVAYYVDPNMLKIDNFNYASHKTKLFQRSTVIFMDIVYVFGVREAGYTFCKTNQSFLMLALFSLCNIGLLVIDHIHFQYNGFLLGILLISIAKAAKINTENEVLLGAIFFTILLNLKHLYLYVAPAFGVWLLKSYCFKNRYFVFRLVKLSIIVIFITFLSFGPFMSQLPQVLSRLFPFKRGLLHSYWAANAWSLYAGVDKLLIVIWKKLGWLDNIKIGSMTGGLVQEDSFTILPTPTPFTTFLITFISMIPALWNLIFSKNKYLSKKFVRCIVLCGLSSFLFGWHVHEKAILTAIIPLCILAATDAKDSRVFTLLSSAGHTSLFPLLYPIELSGLKFVLWFTYLIMLASLLQEQFKSTILPDYELSYIAALPLITLYDIVIHKIIFGDKLPFLPLALTSIYCALGVSYSYLIYYYEYLHDNKKTNNKQKKIR